MQNKISLLIFFAEAQFIFMSAANKDSASPNKLAYFFCRAAAYLHERSE